MRPRQPVRIGTVDPAKQVDAAENIAPLVASTGLKPAFVYLVQPQEIVGLQQLVAELGERNSAVPTEPALHGLAAHHRVDRKVLADIAQKIQQVGLAQPVGIVDHPGRVRTRLEIEKRLQLKANRLDILVDLVDSHQLTLFGAERRVADHPGPAPDKRNRRVPVALQADQPHDRHKTANVKTACRGVKTVVAGHFFRGEHVRRTGSCIE